MISELYVDYYECEMCGKVVHKIGVFTLKSKYGGIKYVCKSCIDDMRDNFIDKPRVTQK